MGLSLNDLEKLDYKDVIKLMLCYVGTGTNKTKKATQSDWDKLAGRR